MFPLYVCVHYYPLAQHSCGGDIGSVPYPLAKQSCGGDIGSVLYVCMCVRIYVRTFVRMYTFCHCSSDLIYYPISILLHTSIGYDNTSNKFAFQCDRIKVKVAVTIFRKTLSSF